MLRGASVVRNTARLTVGKPSRLYTVRLIVKEKKKDITCVINIFLFQIFSYIYTYIYI